MFRVCEVQVGEALLLAPSGRPRGIVTPHASGTALHPSQGGGLLGMGFAVRPRPGWVAMKRGPACRQGMDKLSFGRPNVILSARSFQHIAIHRGAGGGLEHARCQAKPTNLLTTGTQDLKGCCPP